MNNETGQQDQIMDMDAQLVPDIVDPKPDDEEEEVADMDEMMAQMEEEQK